MMIIIQNIFMISSITNSIKINLTYFVVQAHNCVWKKIDIIEIPTILNEKEGAIINHTSRNHSRHNINPDLKSVKTAYSHTGNLIYFNGWIWFVFFLFSKKKWHHMLSLLLSFSSSSTSWTSRTSSSYINKRTYL